LEGSFKNYKEKVDEVDFVQTFDYLAFHSPFAGMVKGGHRKMMHAFAKCRPKEIEEDFKRRVGPSLNYCVQVGNVYSATLYLALCSIIDHADISEVKRIGMYSYGSGCSSEFYSGLATPLSQKLLRKMNIGKRLSDRYMLSMEEYDHLLDLNMEWNFGIKDKVVDISSLSKIYEHFFEGRGLLTLKQVKSFHREYAWS
jgi:polyketide biosynthesis 3-hydroxy-3-methylglutaryl-CoA synthase-like enzyme PksG